MAINKMAWVFKLGFLALFTTPVTASPGKLSDSPLFTTNDAAPNVFLEIDDSGSMDWEILTKPHWHVCDYNNGVDKCSESRLLDNGLLHDFSNVNDWKEFEYIFYNEQDNIYLNSSQCEETGAYMFGTSIELCIATENIDWRVKASALNIIYYNPTTTYAPWERGDGSGMNRASFTAARSNPISGSKGYAELRNLDGFVYHVWQDTHGFSGKRPLGLTINKTEGTNDLVDWWDEHTRYTIKGSSIIVEHITYDGAIEKIGTAKTLSGSKSHPELADKTISETKQNIANWYQYARKRSFVAKGAIANVVSNNSEYRYGLNFINNSIKFPYQETITNFIEIPAEGASIQHNTDLLAGFFKMQWGRGNTPLLSGLERAGKYLDNDTIDGIKRADPITEECQQNFTVLMTDGYWSKSDQPTASIGDADGDRKSVTVADIAKHYYMKDLSPLDNKVRKNTFDSATHQHMVTYTVAFGVSGKLRDTDGDFNPNPALVEQSSSWGDPFTSYPAKIDDLWHAAFNSKGRFISADSPEKVSRGLEEAFANIGDRLGSASSAAFNTTTLTGNSFVYQALFNSSNNKWSGDLLAFTLDPETGEVASQPEWSAAAKLDALPNPVKTRNIFTYNISKHRGVPLRWNDIAGVQKSDFLIEPNGKRSSLEEMIARLEFIRGSRKHEKGRGGKYRFRAREKLLGDIIHSDPVFVGAPKLSWPRKSPFPSTKGVNTYADFKTGVTKDRQAVIYAGSNDGMLHGFDANTGEEVLAYVPFQIFDFKSTTSGLHYLTDPDYTHRFYVDMQLAISDIYIDKKDGIDSNSDGNSKDWHTILIGGGRGGSRGLFALDITDPDLFTETTAHAEQLVLWEFSNTDDADLGFTFSKPAIALMNNGRWAAIFGNGYNSSGNGRASLFIVFIDGGLDGKWTLGKDYFKINTGVGSIVDRNCLNVKSNCNGLSTPQAADINGDGVVDRVYAGDLKGNLWAFDVSARAPTQWKVAYNKVGKPSPLFKASYKGKPQPITSRPILTKHPLELGIGADVLVFFGTGQYLVSGDISDQSMQSFYGVWDKGIPAITPGNLVEQTFISGPLLNNGTDVGDQFQVLTDHDVDYEADAKGWFINFTENKGERVIVDPDLRGKNLFFNTWIPDSRSCKSGGTGILISVDQLNGGPASEPIFDLNGDGIVDSNDLITVTFTDENGETVTVQYSPTGELFKSGLPSSSSFLDNTQYTSGTDDGSVLESRKISKLSDDKVGRLSWQELRQ